MDKSKRKNDEYDMMDDDIEVSSGKLPNWLPYVLVGFGLMFLMMNVGGLFGGVGSFVGGVGEGIGGLIGGIVSGVFGLLGGIIELVVGLLTGIIGLVFGLLGGIIGLVAGILSGVIGLVFGILGGVIGLVAGLWPLILIAIGVALLTRQQSSAKIKRGE